MHPAPHLGASWQLCLLLVICWLRHSHSKKSRKFWQLTSIQTHTRNLGMGTDYGSTDELQEMPKLQWYLVCNGHLITTQYLILPHRNLTCLQIFLYLYSQRLLTVSVSSYFFIYNIILNFEKGAWDFDLSPVSKPNICQVVNLYSNQTSRHIKVWPGWLVGWGKMSENVLMATLVL